MIEITGNLFEGRSYCNTNGEPYRCEGMNELSQGFIPDAICITTNGFVKKNGEAVMGRGCAQEAKKLWPGIEYDLGHNIRKNGNVVQRLVSNSEYTVVAFPVKPMSFHVNGNKSNVVRHMRNRLTAGKSAPGWARVADPELIKKSALDLVSLTDIMGWSRVVTVRPGCGAGELSWDTVGPMLHEILDNRFYSITFRR